ncbi:bifunctional folylpolyglutamate synthase/dihydrofolate synthase [Pseudodesulfovibrio cashew]|uniref:Dihydrofolate synthase/folylpolyglutamate synthase n=2 Tax=Pseudodesulfovibrio cashew TaxID=2678688 RepID=A0A6I6JLK8_9BACT|nr:bifunctional folylpolyglutamate synthase/dihydrofolate synthase [Pseudodesulfovibrio cashew]
MDRLGLFSMDLTLDRMKRFREAHGAFGFPVVHVVGTNGKGSTVTFLCSIARTHGWKVGTFTSPHFLTPRERIQINRAPLPPETWVELANAVLDTPGGGELTYFEFQTCLAMLAFERADVDLAIMEAGLGGRFDATNVFEPYLTLFTPIGMDHEKILGPTLADIARDKAGAIRRGGVALTGPQEPEAMVALQDRAEAQGARLMFAVDLADPVEGNLGVKGMHQAVNARLALAGWRWIAADRGERSLLQSERFGMMSAFLPGRMQRVEADGLSLILDGAHNGHALRALAASLHADDIKPRAVIFACLADKDAAPMVELLKGLGNGPIVVPAMENERASDASALAASIGDRAEAAPSMAAAIERCRDVDGPILICGSLYLLAEFYTLYPEFLTP